MDYGAKIRKIREARGLTIQKLAAEARINNGALSKIERSVEGASVETLESIAKALQVQLAQLFTHEEDADDIRAMPIGRATPIIGDALCKSGDYFDECRYPRGVASYLRHVTTDSHAYALKIKGDELRPRYHPGEYIVIAPGTEAQPTDDVVITLKNGQKLIKNFVFIYDDEFEFSSVNTGDKLTISRSTIKSVHPVAGRYPRGSAY